MKAKTKIKVMATYSTLFVAKNVLINFPKGIKYVEKHKFIDLKDKEVVVSSHFKQEDFYNGQLVVRNFFIDPSLSGQKVVVDEVRIVEKNDSYRGKVTIIIDIILKKVGASSLVPESRLSIGSPAGEVKIPGAPGKFIDFKPIG